MRSALEELLRTIARPAIAVSGGVDSMTLASVAASVTVDVLMFHATSPAVPAEATARVQRFAEQQGWQLVLIRAGEFDDPHYRANPVNRCFFCKTNLYGSIRARTERPILSGANLDDLGEYRPGLDAARLHAVRHPLIEAGLNKQAVRSIARDFGLSEVAELPSSPCLSSRVETGIRIEAAALSFIHDVERRIGAALNPSIVRCRIRAAAVVVELDSSTLSRLSGEDTGALRDLVSAHDARPKHLPILFEEYRNGSAFLVGGRA